MKKYSVSTRDLIVFLGITFGITALMGFILSLVYPSYNIDVFPGLQMLYPALGVMIALLLNKELRPNLPKEFFITYIFFISTAIIYVVAKLLLFHQEPGYFFEIWIIIGSISLIIVYATDKKECLEEFGLKFSKGFKESIPYIGLFVLLYLGGIFIVSLIQEDVNSFIEPFKKIKTWIGLLLLPLSFLLSYLPFLGEEYGWRYFLQPALQERLGKRWGVIVLGLIWGIWHLPINIYYYSPETPLHSLLNQLIVCIAYSVFFGYVYMKTKNIWAISMIHYFNNALGAFLYGATGTDLVYSWKAVLFNLVFLFIIYLPFLGAKEYRKEAKLENKLKEDIPDYIK